MPTPQPASFRLSKWYLDVVTAEGAVAILYAARLHWGRLRVSYASVLLDGPGGQHGEAATIRGVRRPRVEDDTVTWQSNPLDVRGTWRRSAPPIRRDLLRTASGAIQWECHMPLAQATVRRGDTVLTGLGYVESLRLTLPPWKMPFRALRWGRHTSDHRSLIWIEWSAGECRRWVWLDGEEQPGAELTGDGVHGLAHGEALRIEAGRVVRDRGVLPGIGGTVPVLGRRLAGALVGLHESKRLDRSRIVATTKPTELGWALHEVVTW